MVHPQTLLDHIFRPAHVNVDQLLVELCACGDLLAQWMTMDSNPSGIAKNVFNEAISQRFPSTISTSYSAFMIICNSDGSSAVYP